MAKGQNRGNREPKKPKATKKPAAAATTSPYQFPSKPTSPKSSSK